MAIQLQPGDIIFGRKKGPISIFIRLMIGPFPYSHVTIVADPTDQVFTTGVGGKGRKTYGIFPASEFRKLPMQEYLANKDYVVCRYKNLTAQQRKDIVNWCEKRLGQKYPFKKSFRYLRLILKAGGVPKVNMEPSRQHCWEMIAKAYQHAGIELNPRADNIDASGYDIKEIYLSPNLENIYLHNRRG